MYEGPYPLEGKKASPFPFRPFLPLPPSMPPPLPPPPSLHATSSPSLHASSSSSPSLQDCQHHVRGHALLCIHSSEHFHERGRQSRLVGMLKHIVEEMHVQHIRVPPVLGCVAAIPLGTRPTGEAEPEASTTWEGGDGEEGRTRGRDRIEREERWQE